MASEGLWGFRDEEFGLSEGLGKTETGLLLSDSILSCYTKETTQFTIEPHSGN